jgi:hypothetical protein
LWNTFYCSTATHDTTETKLLQVEASSNYFQHLSLLKMEVYPLIISHVLASRIMEKLQLSIIARLH